MYQKILVPVDGSITSNSALQEAVKLAKRLDACLELVYVYEDAIYLVDENYFNYEELQKNDPQQQRENTCRSCRSGQRIRYSSRNQIGSIEQ